MEASRESAGLSPVRWRTKGRTEKLANAALRRYPMPVAVEEREFPARRQPSALSRLKQVPPVGGAILAVCVLAFLFQDALVQFEPQAQQEVPLGILYGPLVVEGQWWRLLTTIFTHANILHLALNMSVLWTLGFTLERGVGSKRFALVSGVCALGASGMVMLMAFDQPTVGASGMILGYAGVMLPIATKQGRSGLLTWLVQIAIISLLPNVSWQGHLGGFLWGLPCGVALKAGPKTFQVAAPILLLMAAAFAVLSALSQVG